MTIQRAIREALTRANADSPPSLIQCRRCHKERRAVRFALKGGATSPLCDACRAAVAVFVAKQEARGARHDAKRAAKRVPPSPVSEVVAKAANPYSIARAKRDAMAKERRARVAIVTAPPVPAPTPVVQRMTAADLRLFARPVRICDLTGGKFRGGRYEWPALVARAEMDGLLRSPGKSTLWELTDAGWQAVNKG